MSSEPLIHFSVLLPLAATQAQPLQQNNHVSTVETLSPRNKKVHLHKVILTMKSFVHFSFIVLKTI